MDAACSRRRWRTGTAALLNARASFSVGQDRVVQVRPATALDADSIAQVHVRSWKSAYRGLVPREYLVGLSVDQRTDVWSEILSSARPPESGVLVLDDADTLVGFLAYGPSRDVETAEATGEVGAIYLLEQVWGRGGGLLLMEEGLKMLRAAAYRSAILWVLRTNERARRFYEAGGWQADGAEKLEDRAGFSLDEVRYKLDL